MAKIEDDIPNFDNLNLPGRARDLLGGGTWVVELAAEPEGVEVVEAEPPPSAAGRGRRGGRPADDKKEEEAGGGRTEEKEPSKLPLYLPVAAAVGLPVIALSAPLPSLGEILCFSTAVYIIALGYIPLALWMGRKTNTVYVVFLGCVLAAVLTAVYCLWMELGRYKFDIKAQEAKQRVSMVWPGENRARRTVPMFSATTTGSRPLAEAARPWKT